jgi:phosphate transport system substrate-binding protein
MSSRGSLRQALTAAVVALPVAVLSSFLPEVAAAREIRIVGSSTVFPFSAAVAENFGRSTDFKTPVVESTGSGGGLKLFCAGVGLDHPDIANSSRRIKVSEVENCAANGVSEIVEIEIGFDGIVIANSRAAKPYALTLDQVFRALAKQIPVDGKLVANPNRTWKDIDPSLPDVKIQVLGPPPTSGTRDAFVELAMEAGAKASPMLAALKGQDEKAFQAVAHAIREDGAYVEAGENDNLIVQKLDANSDAHGVFGFSFLDQNQDQLQGSPIGGQEPTFENIASGAYPVSRSMYFYVKKAHVGKVPGLPEFVAEFTSERAAGSDGYLVDKGLIPLPSAKLQAVRTRGEEMSVLDL